MYDIIEPIERFNAVIGHARKGTGIPSEEMRLLSAKLLLEECIEQIRGLGVAVQVCTPGVAEEIYLTDAGTETECRISTVDRVNLIEVADGVADVLVIAIGNALRCGIDIRPIMKIVNDNNLSKCYDADGNFIAKFREDGKLLKPPGFIPCGALILDELTRQIEASEKLCD